MTQKNLTLYYYVKFYLKIFSLSKPLRNPLNSERTSYMHIVVLLHPTFLLSSLTLDSNDRIHNEKLHAKVLQDSNNAFILKP
jgi:hypothetical protein